MASEFDKKRFDTVSEQLVSLLKAKRNNEHVKGNKIKAKNIDSEISGVMALANVVNALSDPAFKNDRAIDIIKVCGLDVDSVISENDLPLNVVSINGLNSSNDK